MARVPPQNLEAEQALLGALMVDPLAWDQCLNMVSVLDFYRPSHQKIFTAIQELYIRGAPVDIITVSNHLREKSELDSVGGAPYLAEIINQTPSTTHVASYAKIVHDKALLRNLISVSSTIIDKSYEESFSSVEGFLDEVESKIFDIAENKTTGLSSAADLVKSSIDRITELATRREDCTGVPSGFKDMDKLTSGFQPGELVIIAARPSMGKTAFSLNIASHISMRDKKRVAYFSVEMAKEQMMMRMIASEARVNLSDLRTGNVNDNAWPRLIDRAAKMAEAQLFIDDTSGISPYEIRAKSRRLKAQGGLDIIMVDYLQLMQLKQKVESREREVSEISRTLKGIAKELQIPVIALAQLNRGVEGRSSHKPMLSDLRESGSIEQDADVIMMIYREEYYERENPEAKGKAEIIVGKNRNGPVGNVHLKWEAHIGRFSNLDENVAGPSPLPPPPQVQTMRFRPKNLVPGAEA